MPISTRNRAVLHVPNFSSDIKIVNYDNKGTEERTCFFSVSLSDRHKKDGTVIVSFYTKCDDIFFQIKSEIPHDWSMHDYLKVLHQAILLNSNLVVVHSSKVNGKDELGEIPLMNDYFKFSSEMVNKRLRMTTTQSYFSGGL